MNPAGSPVDVLAIGAHPDDVELGIGGILHKLSRLGRTVGILDLTRGEMSTRGTVEERRAESDQAAEILGIARRENAELPDSSIANTPEFQSRLIPFIRSFRPRVLLVPMSDDRHPDHHAAHKLARDAAFFSGLAKIDTGQDPWRPPNVYYYRPYYETNWDPNIVIDISSHFEAKLEAVKAHATQFYNPETAGPETYVSSHSFWENIRTRAAYWGNRIGAQYGEPLYTDGPIGLSIPPGLEG